MSAARPRYAPAPSTSRHTTGTDGAHDPHGQVADEPGRQHREQREPQHAAEQRLRIQREGDQELPELPCHRLDVSQPERETVSATPTMFVATINPMIFSAKTVRLPTGMIGSTESVT